MDEKCNFQWQKLKIHRCTGMCHFLVLHLTFPTTSEVSIFTLWIYGKFVSIKHSLSGYWHHAKFATGHRMIIRALKQNGRNVWLNVQHFVIWYPNENLLRSCKPCLLQIRTRLILILVNTIYTNEADFRYDANWQDTAPWVTPFCYFHLTLKLLSGNQSQILHKELLI